MLELPGDCIPTSSSFCCFLELALGSVEKASRGLCRLIQRSFLPPSDRLLFHVAGSLQNDPHFRVFYHLSTQSWGHHRCVEQILLCAGGKEGVEAPWGVTPTLPPVPISLRPWICPFAPDSTPAVMSSCYFPAPMPLPEPTPPPASPLGPAPPASSSGAAPPPVVPPSPKTVPMRYPDRDRQHPRYLKDHSNQWTNARVFLIIWMI